MPTFKGPLPRPVTKNAGGDTLGDIEMVRKELDAHIQVVHQKVGNGFGTVLEVDLA